MEKYIYLAKIAEQAERYEDMIKYMTKAMVTNELSLEQTNSLIIAYKKVVEKLRTAWWTMKMVEDKEKADHNMERASLVNSHRFNVIQSEICSVCTSMLDLLDNHLLPTSSSTASKVSYMKVKGDYHRYLAEVLDGDDNYKAANDAILAYSSALQMAESEFGPTHPLRLGLTLNFAVFYFEILDSPDKACSMAKEACLLAITEDETWDEPICKESRNIMGQLCDNIQFWSETMQVAGKKSQASGDFWPYKRVVSF